MILANEFFGTPSWPYIVLVLVVCLFSGHGILAMWMKGRKDVIGALITQATANATELGLLRGKIETLERQLDQVRESKHEWRNKANRYSLLFQAERTYAQDLTELLQHNKIPVPSRDRIKNAISS